MCHVGWSEFSPHVLSCGRRTVQLCRAKQHVQCASVQEQWQETECRENPCLEGTQRHAWHPKPFHDRRLPSMQLDVVLLSALHIRGRCLKHLPKECSGSCSRSILSWAGISIKTLQLLSQEERPLKARGAHVPDSSPALGQLAQGDLLCWFLLLQLFVPFTLNISSGKKDIQIVARNLKYFCIYLHYLCFGLQTLKSSPGQEILYRITSVPVD